MRNRNLHTPPPADNSYLEWLRYLVQSSPKEAGELPFLVGLWSCCLHNKGLTPAQQEAVQPYINEGDIFLCAYVFPEPDLEADADMTNVVQFDRRDR